jgi:hypothetical protein
MVRVVVLVWTALAAVLSAGATSFQLPATSQARPAGSTAPRFVAGMLRNDGVLLPFAAYDGRKWSTPWRGGVDSGVSSVLPASVEAIPDDWWGGEAPASWKVWPSTGEPPRAFKLVSPAMVRVGITRQLGLRTDHPPVLPPVPPFELPFPKVGLAIGGDVDLKPITVVSTLSPASREFTALLRKDLEDAEERTLGRLRANTGWKPPFARAARSAVEPQLEAWYVTVTPEGGRMSYVEAVKKYPLVPEDKGCGLESFISGWVHQVDQKTAKAAKPKTNFKAVVSYCDRRGVSYMLPFGSVMLRDKMHWIFQMSGQDHEWYVVVEGSADRARYVAEYQAGSTPALSR